MKFNCAKCRLNFMRCSWDVYPETFGTYKKGQISFLLYPSRARFICTVYGEKFTILGRV